MFFIIFKSLISSAIVVQAFWEGSKHHAGHCGLMPISNNLKSSTVLLKHDPWGLRSAVDKHRITRRKFPSAMQVKLHEFNIPIRFKESCFCHHLFQVFFCLSSTCKLLILRRISDPVESVIDPWYYHFPSASF